MLYFVGEWLGMFCFASKMLWINSRLFRDEGCTFKCFYWVRDIFVDNT